MDWLVTLCCDCHEMLSVWQRIAPALQSEIGDALLCDGWFPHEFPVETLQAAEGSKARRLCLAAFILVYKAWGEEVADPRSTRVRESALLSVAHDILRKVICDK